MDTHTDAQGDSYIHVTLPSKRICDKKCCIRPAIIMPDVPMSSLTYSKETNTVFGMTCSAHTTV